MVAEIQLGLTFLDGTECSLHCIQFQVAKNMNTIDTTIASKGMSFNTEKPRTTSSPWKLSHVQIIILNLNKNLSNTQIRDIGIN